MPSLFLATTRWLAALSSASASQLIMAMHVVGDAVALRIAIDLDRRMPNTELLLQDRLRRLQHGLMMSRLRAGDMR